MSEKRVLITGMSGLIGGVVRKHLEGEYTLSALNRSDVPGVKTYQADISDFNAIRSAFEEQDYVVHLAGRLGKDATEEEPERVIRRLGSSECHPNGVRHDRNTAKQGPASCLVI